MSTAMKNTPEDPKAIQQGDSVEENPLSWSMPDSGGYAQFKCELKKNNSNGIDFLNCCIHLNRKFWSRDLPVCDADIVDDFKKISHKLF